MKTTIHFFNKQLVLCLLAFFVLALEGYAQILPSISEFQANRGETGNFAPGDSILGSFKATGDANNPTVPLEYRILLEGNDFYGNPVVISLVEATIPPIQAGGTRASDVIISFSGVIPRDGTLHSNGYEVKMYTGVVSATSYGNFESALGGFNIVVLPDLSIPPVQILAANAKVSATATATPSGGSVQRIDITNHGSGYDPLFPPRVLITGSGANASATAIVNQQTGRITDLIPQNPGTGYVGPVTVTIDPPPTYMTQRSGGVLYDSSTPYYGGDITRFRTTVTVSGRPLRSSERHRLQTILSTDPALVGEAGSDDFEISFLTVSGDMAGAVTDESRLRSVWVQNTPPALEPYGVAVPAPIGSQATATATIIGGRVDSVISVTSGGSGYDSANPPSVTLTGTGTGATAFATVNPITGSVTAINLVNPGAGYTTAPTVAIAPPRIGARYYTPLPDDGFLDIGERVEMEYEVLMPKNYAGIYYVGAQANSAQQIIESDSPASSSNTTTSNSTLSPIKTNNVFMSNVAARIQLLSGPQESTAMLSASFSSNGSLVSLSNGPSDMNSIDGAGRFVVFQSLASNLVGNASTSNLTSLQNYQQILRREIATGSTEMVSVSSGGAMGNGISQNPSINRSPQNLTEDGKFVAFESQANNLVQNDINAASDIFVRSYGSVLRTNRISVNESGEQGNSGSFNPSISGTGRFVVFESEATNLDLVNPLSTGTTATASVSVTSGGIASVTLNSSGSGYDLFRPPTVTFVSPTGKGAAATATVASNGTISGITVTSAGSGYNLNGSSTQVYVASPQPSRPMGSQIYVHDRDLSGSGVYDVAGNTRTYLVSITNNGSTRATATATLSGNQVSAISVNSAGQGYVPQFPPAVVLSAPNVASGLQATAEAYVDGNGTINAIRVTNPGSGYTNAPTVTIAPRARAAGDALNRPGVYGWNNQPQISDDGTYVTWTSYSSNLQLSANTTAMIGNPGWRGVVYRIKLQTGIPLTETLEAVSVNGNGTNVTSDLANQLAYEPSINSDGSVIAFTSWANNLGNLPDTNGVADVFVRDFNLPPASNRTRRVSESLPRLAVGSITFVSTSSQTSPGSQPPNNNPQTGESVTLNDGSPGGVLTFTFTNAPVGPLDVEIGATASVSRDNLVQAINTQFRLGNTSIIAGNIPSDRIGTVNTNSANNTSIETAADLLAFTSPGANTPANPAIQTAATAVAGQASQPRLLLINTVPGTAGNIDITGTVAATRSGMRFGGRQADLDSGEIDGVLYGSGQPALDASGYTVAFRSTMETLDVFDRSFTGSNGLLQGEILRSLLNRSSNIFVADRNVDPSTNEWGNTERSIRASVNRFGYSTQSLLNTPSSANSHKPALSANGRFVAFSSDAENSGGLLFGRTNLDPLDSNGFRDIFLHDRLIATELPPVVVNNRPQVILTEPLWLSSQSIGVGSRIYLNALATDLDEQLSVDNVTFLVNGIPVPATQKYGNYFSASYLVTEPFESNNIVARVIDNSGADNNTVISPAVNFSSEGTIPQPISVTLSNPDLQGRTPTVGQSITINALVSMPYLAWGNATSGSDFGGIVNFYANGVLLGQVNTNTGANNQSVSFNWIPQTAGIVNISAVATTYNSGGSNWATLLSNTLPPITVVGLPDEAPKGSPENVAQSLFQIVMSRTPSATELAYFAAQLTNGVMTPATMVAALVNLPEYTQFQNKLFDFHYRLGTAPATYNYLSNLSLMTGDTALLPAAAVDATVTNPATPFGSTQGQAAAAQSIVSSAAFSANFPGVASFSNQSFWNWYIERMKLFGGISTVYGGNGSAIVTGVMNTSALAPLGAGVAFTTAFYAAKDPARYGTNSVTGVDSPYQFQLKATGLQWLFTGNWTAPSTLNVTTQAQLNSLVANLVNNSIGQTTWSWVIANGLTGANATANATNGTGQENLLRYAFNGNGTQTLPTMTDNGTAGTPLSGIVQQNGINYLKLTYVRRINSLSVVYIPEFAWQLGGRFEPATWSNSITTIVNIDGIWERVTVTDTAPTDNGAPALSRFGRVRLISNYWTPESP